MSCRICSRTIKEKGFCSVHLKAFLNICEKFEVWERALGILWIDYLVNISKNSLTGEWAKEVAKHLIEDEGRNVKEK